MDDAARTPPVRSLPIPIPGAGADPARADGPAAPSPLGVAAALALLAGVVLCLALPALPRWPWLLLALAVGLGLWLRPSRARLAGVMLCGFGLAGAHAATSLALQLPSALEGRDLVVSGRVVELPRHEPRRTRFRFRVDDGAAQPPALRGRLLQLSWYDDRDAAALGIPGPRLRLAAGSRWRLPLRLRAPRGLRNPGSIDSEKRALADRVAATGHVRDPEAARQLAPARGLDAWRGRLSARIARAVPSPSARFVRALALGDTRALEEADWDTLRATGLTHLIAISGFHVGLVAGFGALLAALAWWLLPALGRRVPRVHAAAVAALVGALGYAAVAGFALPTVRTVLMIAVVVVARLSRRAPRMADALALAALSVLLVDPLAALAPGFWLSFAGVAWLLWCLPHGGGRGWRGRLREFLGAQAVATIGLLPLTVVLFGQASLAGPLANLVAIPWWSLVVVPLALCGTALEALQAGLGAWAWRLAATAFDLSWTWFGQLAHGPLALWWLPQAAWFALPLALAGGFWLLLPRGVPGKPLALLLWLPLLWPQRDLPAPGAAELVVVDVGQGLSVLVRTARHALLYDMGAAQPDGFDAGEQVVVPALHALGVRRLDVAVVSHGDNDHAGGFAAVARAFPPRLAVTPEGAPPLPQGRPCVAGTQWRWDGVTFRFLHPPRDFPYLDNEASCVLRIETAHGAALLTGDIGEVIERDLLRRDRDRVRADVVLVAHHGSHGSSDPGFVTATGARLALVSAGYGNRFHHPHPQAVARWRDAGAQLRVTLDTGAQRVRLAATGITFRGERQARPRLWDAAAAHDRGSR
ncbi:DNA internalization-related competence protein ComEC/Rec2 [Luteimonas weifangensis]|uniref:DNA internalization-related competence protein ComEC/Rec2 n=1 Tax=Cognatiluteimonas weifangensis TaxID=2303539 RepID=A0A372DNK2_9GAMM|nr:DNA internalization-related competence protein ComEC/Rec2 [Luteimonas weifangensis]RFP61089.1 DNA internalization-related competence protein ComEC/Rec2 [Luteimonas weifangensis]